MFLQIFYVNNYILCYCYYTKELQGGVFLENEKKELILYNLINGVYTTRYWIDTKETLTVENMQARLDNYTRLVSDFNIMTNSLEQKVNDLEQQLKKFKNKENEQIKENKEFKKMHGEKPKKFNMQQAIEIKKSGGTVQEKSIKYKCSKGTIYKIMHDKY